jgi:membrane-associated PAP2 superfamily phosphatase
MANQSSLRPTLAYLLQQYTQLLHRAPKYARVIAAAALCTALGGLYERNRRARARAEQRVGRGLVRRNSEVKLNDGRLRSLNWSFVYHTTLTTAQELE